MDPETEAGLLWVTLGTALGSLAGAGGADALVRFAVILAIIFAVIAACVVLREVVA